MSGDDVDQVVSRVDVGDGVSVVTLDRPERRNAMNRLLVGQLLDTLLKLDADRACRAIVLRGSGAGFCAGVDLNGYDMGQPTSVSRLEQNLDIQTHISALIPTMSGLRVPVIAAVHGAAVGAGLAVALACDVRVAGRSAQFGAAFVRVGLSGCDLGLSWLLPRMIGASKAFDLMLSGRMVGSDEADRMGLLSSVVEDGDVIDAAIAMATTIARSSPFGVSMTKQVMWAQLEVSSLSAAIELENRTQVLASLTDGHVEAVAAFLERREPRFDST